MLHLLSSRRDIPAPSPARAALVSVVMGERHTLAWKRLSAGSWLAYAERFGYDLIIFTDRIDPSDAGRSPAWQKLLVLDCPWAMRYERLVWLDSDIVISERAPDILSQAGPPEKISLCLDAGRLSAIEGQVYIERKLDIRLPPNGFETVWTRAQREIYATDDVPPHDVVFNTGVMALSPHHHGELLAEVYRRPERSMLYEQANLSHLLLQRGLAHVLSARFNWGFMEPVDLFVKAGMRGGEDEQFLGEVTHVLLRAELKKAYFLHFYGMMGLLMNYAERADAPALASAA